MRDLYKDLTDEVVPQYALAVYRYKHSKKVYIEAAKIRNGNSMAFHPLTVEEASNIARGLHKTNSIHAYLNAAGILPSQVLSIRYSGEPRVIWYTPAMQTGLLFKADMGLKNGEYGVPPLIWVATATDLRIFAVKDKNRPTAKSALYMPPFHNIFPDCGVCMGSVVISKHKPKSLEEFMECWQRYFFASYFTHLGSLGNPTRSPLNTVWNSLENTDKPFPLDELKKFNKQLKDIL